MYHDIYKIIEKSFLSIKSANHHYFWTIMWHWRLE